MFCLHTYCNVHFSDCVGSFDIDIVQGKGIFPNWNCFRWVLNFYFRSFTILHPDFWHFWFQGIAIHFKIYPIIFSLPMYLALSPGPLSITGLFYINSARFRLVAGTIFTLVVLTALFHHLYGDVFIQEAYLHHITRKDTRHNFSVYFYMLYLTVEDDDIGLNLITFLPQVILLLGLSIKFARVEDIPFAVLCQTFIFVIYNKVCTSQYFLWYLAQLALVLPKLQFSNSESMLLLGLWSFTQASWLLPAYFLEFLGYNSFQFICIESLAFFCANVGIMSKCIRKYLENTRSHQHLEWKPFQRTKHVIYPHIECNWY